MASGRVPKTERTFKDDLFLSLPLLTRLACLAGISDFQYLLWQQWQAKDCLSAIISHST